MHWIPLINEEAVIGGVVENKKGTSRMCPSCRLNASARYFAATAAIPGNFLPSAASSVSPVVVVSATATAVVAVIPVGVNTAGQHEGRYQ